MYFTKTKLLLKTSFSWHWVAHLVAEKRRPICWSTMNKRFLDMFLEWSMYAYWPLKGTKMTACVQNWNEFFMNTSWTMGALMLFLFFKCLKKLFYSNNAEIMLDYFFFVQHVICKEILYISCVIFNVFFFTKQITCL